MHRCRARFLPAIVLALSGAALLAAAPAGAYPNPGTVAGYTLIHDPSMVVRDVPDGPRYTVYGTGNVTLTSNDRISFTYSGLFAPVAPGWWKDYNNNVWAPDVSFHNGKYWMYYAVSATVGHRNSAIGLATSPSGLPGT